MLRGVVRGDGEEHDGDHQQPPGPGRTGQHGFGGRQAQDVTDRAATEPPTRGMTALSPQCPLTRR